MRGGSCRLDVENRFSKNMPSRIADGSVETDRAAPSEGRHPMRKHWLFAAAVALMLSACSAALAAYPSRMIKLIHAYTPGGGNDLIARIIANELTKRWHQNVIVEPRPGGGSIIGTDAVAKAPPDGYTLLVTNVALSMLPSLGKRLPFEVPGSFAPAAIATTGQFMLVVTGDAPYRSFQDVVAAASARPGQIPYSSVGVGSPHHLIMELLKARTGIDLVHVPYKGAAPQMQDLAAGQIQIGISSISSGIALIQSGAVRPLAVTGDRRSPLLRHTPTMIEAGVPDFMVDSWYGVLAPAGTPQRIIERIAAEVTSIFADPALREKLAVQDMVPVDRSDPASFAARIAMETRMWRDVVAAQKLKFE
jgi:tripartite-type tricarboxylate transporter receptor subunit TctC